MIQLDNEQTIWQSDNKQVILTTHRLREMNKSIFGSTIKSIMLEDLTSCELNTIFQFQFLRKALVYFLLINGVVYLLNNYLFKAELIKLFFDEVHIGADAAQIVFILSLVIALVYVIFFFTSIRKVFSFHSTGLTINLEERWLDFDERDGFISRIEQAKDNRRNNIH